MSKGAVSALVEQYGIQQDVLEDMYLARVARESKNEPVRRFSEGAEEMYARGEMDVVQPG